MSKKRVIFIALAVLAAILLAGVITYVVSAQNKPTEESEQAEAEMAEPQKLPTAAEQTEDVLPPVAQGIELPDEEIIEDTTDSQGSASSQSAPAASSAAPKTSPETSPETSGPSQKTEEASQAPSASPSVAPSVLPSADPSAAPTEKGNSGTIILPDDEL